MERIKNLVADNPEQTAAFQDAEEKIRHLMNYWLNVNVDASRNNRDSVIEINTEEKGKMDAIRRDFNQMRDAELTLLAIRQQANRKMVSFAVVCLITGIVLILFIVFILIYFILREFNSRTKAQNELTVNNEQLLNVNTASAEKNWLLAGLAEVNDSLQGLSNTAELCQRILNTLIRYMGLNAGAIYLNNDEVGAVELISSVALPGTAQRYYLPNEGFVGQAANRSEPLHIENIPPGYVTITGGAASVKPAEAVYVPLLLNNEVKGVIELLTFNKFTKPHFDLLHLVGNNIVVAMLSARSREEIMELLEKVQQQKEELENQQEELRQTNEELSVQTEVLQSSEEELRVQEEELRQINAELEEKNEAFETARQALVLKARELEASNTYKSEFLANMSHELRTPLNSVLILAKLLAANAGNNLTEKQVAHANIIHKSGSDLLQLINDILDLSKIEAGKVELDIRDESLASVANDIEQLFSVVAEEKDIRFKVEIEPAAPLTVQTDKQRLEQIIKNLLSNAMKFTPAKGSVTVTFSASKQFDIDSLVVRVQDTGIGISAAKHQLIFEAFQQADGSTSRKYGGTGLGLSITRELVRLLGGNITMESAEGRGSTFTITFPLKANIPKPQPAPLPPVEEPVTELYPLEEQQTISDDRNNITADDKVMLIVEDDEPFATIVRNMAREKGYKTIVAIRGDEGLHYAKKYRPHAIILDMQLPVMDGSRLLKSLKSNKDLRHIPVHIISAADENTIDSTGAVAFLKKPLQPEDLDQALNTVGEYLRSSVKRVLLIAGEHLKDQVLQQLFSQRRFDVKCDLAASIEAGIEQIKTHNYDCVIADVGNNASQVLAQLRLLHAQLKSANIPLIVYLDQDISPADEIELKKVSEVIVRKSSSSYNRLMDELELFLYKVHQEKQQTSIRGNWENTVNRELKGRKVLLVDDDMRNVFALTSALEQEEIEVVTAADGKEALQVLKDDPEIEMVLMDIMMPEMDGIEAISAIRNDMRLIKLPIIALTAKAMTGDRVKCIQAGASDYITKPVDMQKLFSLMRVWLS